jgi:hypothetical protein
MRPNIAERDWKLLRGMKERLLTVQCERAFERVGAVISKKNEHAYKTYLELRKVLEDEDKRLSDMFDDLKRSNAYSKMAAMVEFGLLANADLRIFTQETRDAIETINTVRNRSERGNAPTD